MNRKRKLAFIEVLVILLLLLAFSSSAVAEDLLNSGDKAPEFSGITYDDKTFSLSNATKDSPVLLVFIRGFS